MKNLFTLSSVVIIGLTLVIGCSNPNDSSKKTDATADKPVQAEKPIQVTAKNLTKEYEDNELAADGKYRDKPLAVSGKISNIAETFGSISVSLDGHNQIATVMCSFEDDQKDAVMKLKKGGNVTLIGTGDGSTAGLYVGLKQCKIE